MDQNQQQDGGAGDAPQPHGAHHPHRGGPGFLGFAVDELGGLNVDDIVGVKPAVTMLLHFYTALSDENAALKNERNTLSTYVDNFKQSRSDARTGAILSALSTVFVGAGINLLTNDWKSPVGYVMFIPGLAMLGAGLYFSLRGGAGDI